MGAPRADQVHIFGFVVVYRGETATAEELKARVTAVLAPDAVVASHQHTTIADDELASRMVQYMALLAGAAPN